MTDMHLFIVFLFRIGSVGAEDHVATAAHLRGRDAGNPARHQGQFRKVRKPLTRDHHGARRRKTR